MKIAVLSRHIDWPWARQTPDGKLVFAGHTFSLGLLPGDTDCVVVFDGIDEAIDISVPLARRIFVASEPASVHKYEPAYLRQFGTVITTDEQSRHPNRILTQPALNWHVGVWAKGGGFLAHPMSYREFESFRPRKSKLVSVVSSNKAFTEGHRARLKFVEALGRRFGNRIDVFGRGIAGFTDKLEVLADYRFHIALENSSAGHYWTEKLADPLLTLTYPIYYGCPNVFDYFDRGALTAIDIEHEEEALAAIERLIDSDVDERSERALIEARRQVLEEYNFFAMIGRVAAGTAADPHSRRPFALRTERSFQRPPLATRAKIAIAKVPVLNRVARAVRDRWRAGGTG